MRAKLTLKGRALQWLAQREQSRVELRRKLLRVVAAEVRRRAETESVEAGAEAGTGSEAGAGARAEDVADAGGEWSEAAVDNGAAADVAVVEALLDWLEAHRYLSAERFVESRVHARQSRFGNLRIRSELAQHAVELPSNVRLELAESETSRAFDVLARRFAVVPRDAAEQARQSRFLAGRGFSPDVIRRVMRQRGRRSEATPAE